MTRHNDHLIDHYVIIPDTIPTTIEYPLYGYHHAIKVYNDGSIWRIAYIDFDCSIEDTIEAVKIITKNSHPVEVDKNYYQKYKKWLEEEWLKGE